jgi:hypothetical protein
MTEDEAPFAYENRDMFVILPRIYNAKGYRPRIPRGFRRSRKTDFSSQNARLITGDHIRQLLKGIEEKNPIPVQTDS